MNAVVARVLDCFYLMEHSMVHQYKCSTNHFVWYLKRKFIFEASQNVPNTTFPIPALITSKQKSLGFITTYRKYYCCHHCICHHHIYAQKCQFVRLSGCQVVRLSGCHVVKFDPWDMLNNFCFHVYAQKSVF